MLMIFRTTKIIFSFESIINILIEWFVYNLLFSWSKVDIYMYDFNPFCIANGKKQRNQNNQRKKTREKK